MDLLNIVTPEEKGLLSELKAARKRIEELGLEYIALFGQLQDAHRTCAEVVRKYKEFYGVAESGLWSGEDIADLLTEIEGKLLEVCK